MQGQTTVNFSGRTWRVKEHLQHKYEPGPNFFSPSQGSVWVDGQGRLHLKIRKINGVWCAAQVVLNESLGYGRYVLCTASRVDLIDQNAVLGIFLYDGHAPEQNYRQIDIEISKWGNPHNQNAQYVIQPYQHQGNMKRFNLGLNGDFSSHIIDWKPNQVHFEMLHDHFNYVPQGQEYYKISDWTYTNKQIHNGSEKFRINLWLLKDSIPSNGQDVEVVIQSFNFIPAN